MSVQRLIRSTARLFDDVNASSAVLVLPDWMVTARHVIDNVTASVQRQVCFDFHSGLSRYSHRKMFSLDPGTDGSGMVFIPNLDIAFFRIRPDRFGKMPADFGIEPAWIHTGERLEGRAVMLVGHPQTSYFKTAVPGREVLDATAEQHCRYAEPDEITGPGFSGGAFADAATGELLAVLSDFTFGGVSSHRTKGTCMEAILAALKNSEAGEQLHQRLTSSGPTLSTNYFAPMQNANTAELFPVLPGHWPSNQVQVLKVGVGSGKSFRVPVGPPSEALAPMIDELLMVEPIANSHAPVQKLFGPTTVVSTANFKFLPNVPGDQAFDPPADSTEAESLDLSLLSGVGMVAPKYLHDIELNKPQVLGTCVLVGRHWILTAHHVIDSLELGQNFEAIFGFYPSHASEATHTNQQLFQNALRIPFEMGSKCFFSSKDGSISRTPSAYKKGDWALIKLAQEVPPEYLPMPARYLSAEQLALERPMVFVCSYMTGEGVGPRNALQHDRGSGFTAIARVHEVVKMRSWRIFHRAPAISGNSGAPLMLTDGSFIGIHVTSEAGIIANTNLASSALHIAQDLRRQGFDFEQNPITLGALLHPKH